MERRRRGLAQVLPLLARCGSEAAGGELLFKRLVGELCDAKYKLQAAQFDMASVMEECSAFPSRTIASDQTGAAVFTVTGSDGSIVGLAAHNSALGCRGHGHCGRLLLLFPAASCKHTRVNTDAYNIFFFLSWHEVQRHFFW